MAGVTLHAEERLGDLQERVVGRPVRAMAIGALFGDVGMLVDERPLVFHVAPGAERFAGHPFQVLGVARQVRVVAVRTRHLVLRDGVV